MARLRLFCLLCGALVIHAAARTPACATVDTSQSSAWSDGGSLDPKKSKHFSYRIKVTRWSPYLHIYIEWLSPVIIVNVFDAIPVSTITPGTPRPLAAWPCLALPRAASRCLAVTTADTLLLHVHRGLQEASG